MNLRIFKGYERFEDRYPSEAVKYALEHKEEAIPELLEILEYTQSNAENLSIDPKYLIHFPAIYLLAYFRETRAYEHIMMIAALPDDVIYDLLGDTVTEDFKNIIASVCDGNIEPIKRIIENSSLDDYVRIEALESLLILLSQGVVSREELIFYFKELFNGKLAVDHSSVWDDLPRYCSLIHPKGLKDDIEKAVADGKVMEVIADLDFMNEQLERPIEDVLDELKEDDYYSFISLEEVEGLEEWVGGFHSREEDDDDDEYETDEDSFMSDFFDDDKFDEYDDGYETSVNVPFKRESFVGRNDPCPCGSGKKYKKCCLGKE